MKNTRNTNPDIDLIRGKRFVTLCETVFPKQARAKIGEKLGGYGESAVRNWESGTGLPNRALAELVIRGISMEWLLCGSGKMRRRDDSASISHTPNSDLTKTAPTAEKKFPSQSDGRGIGEHDIEELKNGATSLNIAIQTLLVEAARGNLAVAQVSPVYQEMMEAVRKLTSGESAVISRPNEA